jgi:replicative DNA helicase
MGENTLEQKSIIAEWLLGNHKEDMQYFDALDFDGTYQDIFQVLKAGECNQVAIAEKCRLKLADIAALEEDTISAFYGDALSRMILKMKTRRIKAAPPDKLEATIAELEKIKCVSEVEFEDNAVVDFIEALDRRAKEKPIEYGIGTLDYYTGGLKKGELTTIAARPANGKSALTLQIATHIARQKKRVLYLPLEMSIEQVTERMFCRFTNTDHSHFKSGLLTQQEWGEVSTFGDKLSNLIKGYLKFSAKENTLQRIEAAIDSAEPQVVVVDQLSLIRGAKANSIRESYSQYTKALKAMAMNKNISIILVAQLRRNDESSVPTLNDLKESGSIEEDSDNVILLHRPPGGFEDSAQDEDFIHTMLILAKHRNGINIKCKLFFYGKHFAFADDNKYREYQRRKAQLVTKDAADYEVKTKQIAKELGI